MVRGGKASPAASNSARTELTCGSGSGAIQRTHDPGSGKKGLARFLVPRRSFYGGLWWWRSGGAAGPRRRGVLCSNCGSAAGARLGFMTAEVRASSGRQRGYL